VKVLVAHNYYASTAPSGENLAVTAEVDGLKAAGVTVLPYFRSSDEIDTMRPVRRARLAVRPFWSMSDARTIRATILREQPDLLHVHNVNPLLSPAIIRVARDVGLPVVHSVHNVRHVCVNGTFMRDGTPCHDCVGRSFALPAIQHACYRGSRPQSVVMTVAERTHRSTWHAVDRFLAPSSEVERFLRDDFGVPRARIRRQAHAVADPGPPVPPGDDVVFVGRLSEEKGIRLLLDAWSRRAPDAHRLVIVGAGPEEDAVRRATVQRPDVLAAGLVSAQEVSTHIERAAVVVVPSTGAEAFGRVAVEALAHGRPVVATNHGGLVDIVTSDVGWLVEPSSDALSAALARATAEDNTARMSAARSRYLEHYTPAAMTSNLISIYEELLRASPRRRSA
jgi:glycosyltransferase involved in cell wall biosynthesis